MADFFTERGSQGTSITVPAKVVQFFGSRTLLLSLDRPLKVKVKGVCACVYMYVQHVQHIIADCDMSSGYGKFCGML